MSGTASVNAAVGALIGLTSSYVVQRIAGTVEGTQIFGTAAMTMAVLAALVAIGAVSLFSWGRVRYPVVYGVGLAGLAIVGAVNALPAPGEWNELPVALGVAVGLLMVPVLLTATVQVWFFGGLIAAGVLGYQWDNLLGVDHLRYPGSIDPPVHTWQVAVVVVSAAALLTVMWWRRADHVDLDLSGRTVAFGATLALTSGLLARLSIETSWLPFAAVLLVLAIFVAGVRWLPRESLATLAALTAAAAVLVIEPGLDREPSTVTLVAGSAAVIGGLVVGLHLRRAGLAVGVCAGAALVGALSFVSDASWVRIVAGAVLLFAAAMAGGSALPLAPSLLAGWTVLPVLASLTARELPTSTDGAVPAWVGVTADSYDSASPFRLHAELTAQAPPHAFEPRPDLIVPGLIAAALCAACAVWLTRRTD
ncbi:hypothetical protein ACFWUP_00585 [Nocardia sp. NPDC058658]|uniref:hypothetical protein n=1 Tax=Nocardia sp. NPDC058658 TaxID=3346580 RepID=UPI00366939B6